MSDAAERCSLVRKCSAGGVECTSSDRACQERARSHDLEVACDRPGEGETVFVYCPPLALSQQRDSSAVWVLLLVAIAIAVVGSAIAYFALRKR